MAQANIKDRIKEMRLRVLAEPLGESAALMDSSKSPEDDSKAPADNPKTDTLVRKNTTQTKTVKKPKSGKKKTSKKSTNWEREEAAEAIENAPEQELKVQAGGQAQETQNEYAPENLGEQPKKEIIEADINRQEKTKETPEITEPIADNNAPDEQKNSSGEIIELTDKWVELEVRSRLSGLEQQEKQTRAMLKEIVEILDRIETPKYSNKASPVVSDKKLLPTSSTSQTSETKKRHWTDIIKRIFDDPDDSARPNK